MKQPQTLDEILDTLIDKVTDNCTMAHPNEAAQEVREHARQAIREALERDRDSMAEKSIDNHGNTYIIQSRNNDILFGLADNILRDLGLDK